MSKLNKCVKFGVMAVAMAALSACMSITEVSGPFKAGAGTYNLDRSWNNMTAITMQTKGVHLLTLDGLSLNRLYLSHGLTEGQHLARPDNRREKNTPAWRADMGITEQMEFVKDSVEAYGYSRVEASSPRPVTISDQRGVRFELNAVTSSGLEIKGFGQVVTKDSLGYVAIYLAPGEHFYAQSQASAAAAMDSLSL